MNINNILKKEGIKIIRPLSVLDTNIISNKIANNLALAFPEHGLDKQELFSNLSRLNMYIVEIPEGAAKAKYFSTNCSIYFDKSLSIDEISHVAMHECIHFLQEMKDENGNLERLGLAHFGKNMSGNALNEAAVQLMTSEANKEKRDTVTYYGVTFSTISPSYYPLQCVLVSQMAYFTGSYPLFHSTLFSNDIFKNTFVAKCNLRTYETIQKNLDKLVMLEDLLCALSNDLQEADNDLKRIHNISKYIANKKNTIMNLFLKTQNLIISTCFNNEFNCIRNVEDIRNFKSRLYQFKDYIGISDYYTFYHDYYYQMMMKLEQKEEYIVEHGDILLGECVSTAIDFIRPKHNFVTFFQKLIYSIKKLNQLRTYEHIRN